MNHQGIQLTNVGGGRDSPGSPSALLQERNFNLSGPCLPVERTSFVVALAQLASCLCCLDVRQPLIELPFAPARVKAFPRDFALCKEGIINRLHTSL